MFGCSGLNALLVVTHMTDWDIMDSVKHIKCTKTFTVNSMVICMEQYLVLLCYYTQKWKGAVPFRLVRRQIYGKL